MLRHLPQPLHAGVFHLCLGIKTLGEGMADEGGALFRELFQKRFFFGNEGVGLRAFVIEKAGDGVLFFIFR